MTKDQVHRRILDEKMIAVVRASSAESAIAAARAICAGGISLIEITLTVPGAIDAIAELSRSPEGARSPGIPGSLMCIGVGTVLDAKTAGQCIDAGAQFLVSPGFDREMVDLSISAGKLTIAGALTPTEVIAAWKSGADFVKIFRCASVGGPAYIKALKAALPQIGMIPTGGVNLSNIAEFLRAGASAIGIGGELVSSAALQSRNFAAITNAARRFSEVTNQASLVPTNQP